ncbi:ribonuclease H-like domain-containing protein [Hysterangium stoloniferum]|nr:ribonuclease H-like domain-containing protein [Hysterangium stoloniferum]
MSSGDDESKIPSPTTSFDEYQLSLQSAAVSAIKSSMGLPKDISYHRSLDRKFGKRLDACSDRILTLTSRLLDFAQSSSVAESGPHVARSGDKGKRRLENEEDVVDSFHSLVVDVMDQLLERSDACLDELMGRIKPPAIPIKPQPQPQTTSKSAKMKSRLDPALLHASHLPKPQHLFRPPVDNTNTAIPWQPVLTKKYHGRSLTEIQSGSHPYQDEITQLSPPAHYLSPPSSPSTPIAFEASPPLIHISHVSQLPSLLEALKQTTDFAVDLEHHTYRSFSGFVCLMQISTRTQDWIIECLDPEIRVELVQLNEVFTDPNIVKVFHGAESDIIWLQRDFSIYVVNYFDTHHATHVLNFPKHSLASLLEMYCDFIPDKRYQRADWRIRPLPEEMLLYARSDTHFLLYIYDHLRTALLAQRTPPPQPLQHSPIIEVLKRSSETALRNYVRETYDAADGSGPGGWGALVRKWNGSLDMGGVHGVVFKAIHAWRDAVAREEDESTRYVLPNLHILRLAERPPKDLPTLLSHFQPVPPIVRVRSLELLDVIKDAVKRAETQQPVPEVEMVSAVDVQTKDISLRLVGTVDRVASSGLWDRSISNNMATSSSLLGSMSATPMSGATYISHKSSLFGSMSITQVQDLSADKRYCDVMARIHSKLIIAPTPPIKIPDVASATVMDLDIVEEDSSAAAVAEIPFIPPAQRQSAIKADPDANDVIVVVGQRQKKRKRKEKGKEVAGSGASSESTPSKKLKDQNADAVKMEAIEPFDFDSAPNILDQPKPTAAPVKRKRQRGADAAVQYGNFGAPPRNMSEVKGGNQSHTFR